VVHDPRDGFRFDPHLGENGHFGEFGGQYMPETLMSALEELTTAFTQAREDPHFQGELDDLLRHYAGRPTALTHARRLSEHYGGIPIWLKREDLAHTGAHKINNALGQVLLARHMGKERVIAETGAGQHGVATATACAVLGLQCRVYMGEVDMERQALNVYRMRLLGAEVVGVASGSRTLKDAINEAIRDWVASVRSTHYVLGSVLGPHPFPWMVREFQSVIGREARAEILERCGRLPTELVACVGGGSNAIGLFHAFLADSTVRMTGVEAGGSGEGPGQHAARFLTGIPGVLHGTRSLLLQDSDGNVLPTHSVSAGLDYPSVGPEHAYYGQQGRIEYTSVRDEEALAAFHRLSELEGIVPALESSHALAHLARLMPRLGPEDLVLVNLSGRGDKDVDAVRARERRT
jgi:tryptophan synthase beta chain